jgi:hypothetical protein
MFVWSLRSVGVVATFCMNTMRLPAETAVIHCCCRKHGMWCRVGLYAGVSKERVASIFRLEELTRVGESVKQRHIRGDILHSHGRENVKS